jgi:hypothetical protein
MRLPGSKFPLTAMSLAAAAFLSACGGGSSGTPPTTLRGAVVDGYITGATICLDLNANRACDAGEPSAVTGVNGAYSLTAPAGADLGKLHLVVEVPTTATDGGVPITAPYKMLAPATMPQVVSPLTTVVSTNMLVGGKTVSEARIAARADLAMPVGYDFLKDHIGTPDVQAQNVAKVMAAVLQTAVGASTPNDSALSNALATIKTHAPSITPSSVAGLVSGLGPTSITFETGDASGYALGGSSDFGGAISSLEASPPAGATGRAAKVVKGAVAETWAGTTFLTLSGAEFVSASSRSISMRVWAPAAGTKVRLKLENSANGANNIEMDATTSTAGWQTLVFNSTALAAGTSAYVEGTVYNRASIFFNFGVSPVAAETYFFDNVSYTPNITSTSVTFEAGDTTGYALAGSADFGGAVSSLEATPPTGANGRAAKVVKGSGTETWAGTTFLTLSGAELISASSRTVSVRVWSPASGVTVRLKLEQQGDNTKYVEMDKVTTAVGWQTLEFDSSVVATAAYVEGSVYNRASIFFNFGVSPSSAETYYFDDVTYTPSVATTYVAPPPSTDPTTNAATPTKNAADVLPIYSDAYTVTSVSNLDPNWGETTVASDITISGNNVRKLTNLNYQGLELNADFNVTTYTHLHIDVYTTTTAFQVFLVARGAGEKAVTLQPTAAGWNSFDIPLTDYSTGVGAIPLSGIFQLKFEGTPPGTTVYFDNLYFWK